MCSGSCLAVFSKNATHAPVRNETVGSLSAVASVGSGLVHVQHSCLQNFLEPYVVPELGAGALAAGEVVDVAHDDGTCRTWPMLIWSGLLMELAACRHCTVVPHVVAMLPRVSPELTLRVPPVDGQAAPCHLL